VFSLLLYVKPLTEELLFVIVLANKQVRKVLFEVTKLHPEQSIIFVIEKINLLLGLLCPKIRLVTPRSIPLEVAPWVSNIDNLRFKTVTINNLSYFNDTVGMATNQSHCSKLFLLFHINWCNASSYNMLIVVSFCQYVPQWLIF
jgi:hypothetical protein